MKILIYFLLLACFLVSCSSSDSDSQVQNLRTDILGLQDDIRILSNEMVSLDEQGIVYTDQAFVPKIATFKQKREEQVKKIDTLKNMLHATQILETIVCGDFEDFDCFIDNWEIRKNDNAVVQFSQDCSYNGSTSLFLSAPFDYNLFNVPGLEVEGYCNDIEAATIYKIRFWARYSGQSDKSNGPLLYMAAVQDGEWLDYIYISAGHSPNEIVDKDWRIYSFQIATKTNSPLEILFGTNLSDVCIDDIHIVKK